MKFSALIARHYARWNTAGPEYECGGASIVFAEPTPAVEQKFVDGGDVSFCSVKRWFEGVIELLGVKRLEQCDDSTSRLRETRSEIGGECARSWVPFSRPGLNVHAGLCGLRRAVCPTYQRLRTILQRAVGHATYADLLRIREEKRALNSRPGRVSQRQLQHR